MSLVTEVVEAVEDDSDALIVRSQKRNLLPPRSMSIITTAPGTSTPSFGITSPWYVPTVEVRVVALHPRPVQTDVLDPATGGFGVNIRAFQ